MQKAIIDYSNYADADLDETASTIIKQCTGNAAFTFTGAALTNATTAQTDYHTKLAAVALGGPVAVTAKDTAKATLVNALRVLCQQVNLQANGDLAKLQSSGAPLTKEATNNVMPVPTGMIAMHNDVSGSMDVKVDKPNVTDHGTMFAYNLVTNVQPDINKWPVKHANGHSLTISGLTPGQNYQFTAAYKGKDTDPLVWCPPITKMAV